MRSLLTACSRLAKKFARRRKNRRTLSSSTTNSSFDIRMAPGIKVPDGYGAHFKSFDGKERNFLVEGNGGPSWFTEYNVLEGLSARTFGAAAA